MRADDLTAVKDNAPPHPEVLVACAPIRSRDVKAGWLDVGDGVEKL